jgi:hypothetical protein
VLTKHPEAKRLLLLGRSFYEALCAALVPNAPEKAISLYWRLQEEAVGVHFVDRYTNIRILDYALFNGPSASVVMAAWDRRLMQCRIDRELMEVVLVAQAGNGEGWLWSWIERGLHSPIMLEQARSFTLVSFLNNERAGDLLNEGLKKQAGTWIAEVIEIGLQRWGRGVWAKHWYRRFLSASEEVEAWASFRLFLQCVDSRFWLWQQQLQTEAALSATPQKRLVFLENNTDTITNNAQKNERSLADTFLGQKVLRNQTWPWMQVR